MEVDFDDSSMAGKRGGNEVINYNTWETEDGGLVESNIESEEIMRAFKKRLPKWKGFDNIGWMDKVGP